MNAPRSIISKRRLTITTAALGLLLVGCLATDRADAPDAAPVPTVTALSATMRISGTTAIAGLGGNEHCRVHTSRLATWPARRQLLIYRGSTLRGLCTVDPTGHDVVGPDGNPAVDLIQMTPTGLINKIWQSGDSTTEIAGVTVRDQLAGATTGPVVVERTTTWRDVVIETLAGVDDNVPREYLSPLPAATTRLASTPSRPGVTVGYLAPHPFENPMGTGSLTTPLMTSQLAPVANPGGLGRALHQWVGANAVRDPVHDAMWTVGMKGDDFDQVSGPTGSPPISNTSRFHITSTDLDATSFPGLQSLAEADLDYAVAFHGTGSRSTARACNQGAMIGGRLGIHFADDPFAFRRGIAENIRLLVDPTDPVPNNGTNYVELAPDQVRYSSTVSCTSSDPACEGFDQGSGCGCASRVVACEGFDEGIGSSNIVNEAASYVSGTQTIARGLQIENGFLLDPQIYERIGGAVHQVFDCLNAPADVTLQSPVDEFAARASSGAYWNDACQGFVVDVDMLASAASFWGELQTCQVGARTHIDIYRWSTESDAWDRVGGGTRTYGACSPAPVFLDSAYDDDLTDSLTPSFDHVLSGDTSGRYRLVIYGYTGAYFNPTTAVPVQARAGWPSM